MNFTTQEGADAPQREPHVVSAARRIEVSLDRAEKAASALEGRLTPVLVAERPAVNPAGTTKVAEVLVPLAEQLTSQGRRMEAIAIWLENMVRRLEV